jgi:hypothetical protein
MFEVAGRLEHGAVAVAGTIGAMANILMKLTQARVMLRCSTVFIHSSHSQCILGDLLLYTCS